MTRLRAIWRRLCLLATALCIWFCLNGAALAQAKATEAEKPKSNNYLASYAIVLLGIGLGLLFVCNGSRRRDRAKPVDYGADE